MGICWIFELNELEMFPDIKAHKSVKLMKTCKIVNTDLLNCKSVHGHDI